MQGKCIKLHYWYNSGWQKPVLTAHLNYPVPQHFQVSFLHCRFSFQVMWILAKSFWIKKVQSNSANNKSVHLLSGLTWIARSGISSSVLIVAARLLLDKHDNPQKINKSLKPDKTFSSYLSRDAWTSHDLEEAFLSYICFWSNGKTS